MVRPGRFHQHFPVLQDPLQLLAQLAMLEEHAPPGRGARDAGRGASRRDGFWDVPPRFLPGHLAVPQVSCPRRPADCAMAAIATLPPVSRMITALVRLF